MSVHGPKFLLALVLALLTAGGSAVLRADPYINEFMAANSVTLADDTGAYSDWIEIYNPGPNAVSLEGWYLTDNASNRTKWQFPAVTVQAGGYLVVFASGRNRRDPTQTLHTNFALSASGEYLGLIKSDGMTVASEFSPTFPAQETDISYGRVRSGSTFSFDFLARPTPGAPNSTALTARLTDTVSLSRTPGPYRFNFSLELSGANAAQVIRYVLVPAASGASAPEPTANSTLYTGPIALSTSVVVRAAVFSADGAARGPVRTAHYAKVASNLSTFSSTLPVVVVDTLGSGGLAKDGVDHASWIYTYAPRSGTGSIFSSTPQVASPLTTTVRGSSSAEFPKKGYNLAFLDDQGDKREQALLDLTAHEKWALVAPWKYDQNYVNNSFVYTLSNQMGRWAPRTRFAEVFLNTAGDEIDQADYAGIYLITDRIEVHPDRVNVPVLTSSDVGSSAVTGGYILKIDAADPDDVSWTTSRGYPETPGSSVVLVAPKASAVAPAQLSYIRDYVQRMENALVEDRASGWSQRTYLDYIDRGAWVDHHILNVFTANPDALVRSAYFTKNRNGKLAAGPVWDFDRALGSYWDERSYLYDVWAGLGSPDVWRTGWWGILATDPEFMQDWVDRWQALRVNELSGNNMRALVDSLSASIGEAAAARDAARWPDNASPYGSYAAQVERLKGWVTLRAEWIDRQFVARPTVSTSGSTLTFTAPAGAQLAYTLDGSDPRMMNGGVAPNAIVASTPVTVPASANVNVRSYNASLRDVFPGSPWSSAVGGERSSPLSPRARLINISARAAVGTGENALIAGVVVADTESKQYLARAIGPTLAAFGASGTVPDPQLSVYNGIGSEIFRNNGWSTGPDAALIPLYSRSVGAFPLTAGSRDSALASTLAAGAYTLQISTPSNQPGIGLAELYELDSNGRTVNLSTRAQVRTGDGVLIGGFVVEGPAYQRMLIRAVGPTLAAFGVAGALADPIITIYSGQEIVATNDRWQASANAAAVASATSIVGAFALAPGSEDAALLITLPPGAYTVEVKGKGGTEGVALLEIYGVP